MKQDNNKNLLIKAVKVFLEEFLNDPYLNDDSIVPRLAKAYTIYEKNK